MKDPQAGRTAPDAVTRALGLEGLSSAELEQPLVFHRRGWDHAWLSRRAVTERVAGVGEGAGSIVDHRRDADGPAPELEAFLDACRLLAGLEPEGDLAMAAVAQARAAADAVPASLAGTLGALGDGDRRWVAVVPGGWHRADAWLTLCLVLGFGGAVVLPPEEGAWAATVLWSRPSLVLAAPDQLEALRDALDGRRPRSRRRALAPVRALVGWSAGRDGAAPGGLLAALHAVVPDAVCLDVDADLGRVLEPTDPPST